MVKMRYVFIVSLCIHGLLAFSMVQTPKSFSQIQQTFSLALLSTSKETVEKVELVPTKISSARFKKKKVNPVAHKSIKNNNFLTPTVIYSPVPHYPDSARASGQEGVFSVKIFVGIAGNVEGVEIKTIKGNLQIFEEELLKTIKTWKFNPSHKQLSFEIPVSFELSHPD